MLLSTIKYDEPIFRPPAEAASAIVQATLGCSWNKCGFCEMYQSKKFKARDFADVKREIETLAQVYVGVRKVFLADGNAFVLSASKLLPVLDAINKNFGRVKGRKKFK